MKAGRQCFRNCVDLRDDPVDTLMAVNISSYWLEKAKLLQKAFKRTAQKYTSTGNNILSKIRTVILANGGSASAAEIVSEP